MKKRLTEKEIDSIYDIIDNPILKKIICDLTNEILNCNKILIDKSEGDFKVIFNPTRVKFSWWKEDQGLELYFHIEQLWGETKFEHYVSYKKAFVKAFIRLTKAEVLTW